MGRKVALLVGVGSYGGNEQRGLKPLQCPLNGVEALEAVLKNPEIGGYEVTTLSDPDSGTLRRRMGEVFSPLKKDDLALFYFTGHGIKDMGGEFHLTAADTALYENGRLNLGTAVDARFVRTTLANCYAQRKVVILDCCFGAAFAEGFLTMDDAQVDVQTDLGGEGWVVLTAATARNYALEQDGEALSVYTRYLVEGLKTGAAVPEGHEHITVSHLHRYVRGKVQTAAPTMEPTIFNGHQGERIQLARAVLNPELTYRQKVQTKIRRGRIAPAGRGFLAEWRLKLRLNPERAAEIEAEVLKPYAEKQRHLDKYDAILREEIAEEFPLSPEAIQDLKDLQKLWNLPDAEVEPLILAALNEQGLAERQGSQAILHPVVQQPQAAVPPPRPPVGWASPTTPSAPPPPDPALPTFSFEVVTVDVAGKITNRRASKADYHREQLPGDVALDLVKIPSGEFWMGQTEAEKAELIRLVGEEKYQKYYARELPRHQVKVPGFSMGKYAVTQAQWRAVAGLPKVKTELEPDPAQFKGDNRPIEKVSWHEAVEFCDRISKHTQRDYRLPSEAEWEYACRAGTETPFHFGETITSDLVNYDGNSIYGQGPKGLYRKQTTDVGSFPPNGFGLYDMHGNVWEWCLDFWHDSYEDAPTDGSPWLSSGDEKLRLVRGGSWDGNPWNCRCARRNRYGPDDRDNYLGFRVVCASA
jgi:formylglycine-generating enzyme required for sulfatase activity